MTTDSAPPAIRSAAFRSVRMRILLPLLVALPMLAGVGLVGVFVAKQITERAQQTYADDLVGTAQIGALQRQVYARWAGLLDLSADPAELQEGLLEQLEVDRTAIIESIASIRASDSDGQQADALSAFERAVAPFEADAARALQGFQGNARQRAVAFDLVHSDLEERFGALLTSLDGLVQSKNASAEQANQANASAYASGRNWIIALTLGSLLVALAVALRQSRTIVASIRSVVGAARALAGGDLSTRAPVQGADEVAQMADVFNQMAGQLDQTLGAERQHHAVLKGACDRVTQFSERIAGGDLSATLDASAEGDLGRLAASLNTMVATLAKLTGDVKGGASAISSASAQILTAVNDHTATATEQAAAISQTSATVHQVVAAAEQSAQRVADLAVQAESAATVVNDGLRVVDGVSSEIATIGQRVDRIAETIRVLADHSESIGNITETVNRLADQSNLLALNATIEASQAGEHGRGFAVVADAVRDLAEQSKQATQRVQAIVREIRTVTSQAVVEAEHGVAAVETGAVQMRQAAAAIDRLGSLVGTTATVASQVALTTREQTLGLSQVGDLMGELTEATARISTGAAQTRDAVESLTSLAQQLETTTAVFHTADECSPAPV